MRHPQRLNVPIQLARDVPEPLQDQLAAQLRSAIAGGQLAPRTRMPSTRTLALVLGISRGVALAAYERLLAEGHISSRWGSGTYVSGPITTPTHPCRTRFATPTHPCRTRCPALARTCAMRLTAGRRA
ncbi:winged helix-turn-helix domain-containing protein [Nonomuraea sp. NPDC049709]|uniref:winged helix-turn-helix domain-containing protein n=1 Tax=Nonomuraea sp. NPDC049709 TaxID=3154736 RepID=UPI003426E6D7